LPLEETVTRKPMTNTLRITEAVERLKGVFLESPGTPMPAEDAARRAGVEQSTCDIILETLENTRFLTRDRSGRFVHPDD
jgi:DNA-binding IclR family transcriptional regulator